MSLLAWSLKSISIYIVEIQKYNLYNIEQFKNSLLQNSLCKFSHGSPVLIGYLICSLVSVIVMLQIGLRLLSPCTMGVGEGGGGYLEVSWKHLEHWSDLESALCRERKSKDWRTTATATSSTWRRSRRGQGLLRRSQSERSGLTPGTFSYPVSAMQWGWVSDTYV